MSQGAPVIVSNATSLPEVAGDAGLYVNPDNMDEIADAMRRLESDAQLRSDLKQRGLVQAVKFSWTNTAAQIHDIYLEALTSPKRSSSDLKECNNDIDSVIGSRIQDRDRDCSDFSCLNISRNHVIARIEEDFAPGDRLKAMAYRWITRRPGLKTYIKRFRFSRSLVRRLQKNILGY